MVKKAIIPAAGYGTRSLPITKVVPKEMFPVGKKPAIEYIVNEAVASGIEQILIVVSRTKNIIVDYFDRSLELETFLDQNNKSHLKQVLSIPDVEIHFTRQQYAKGLGDAIHHGVNFVNDEPFAVLLPDDLVLSTKQPAIKQLIDRFNKVNSSIVGLNQVPKEELKNYGVVRGEVIGNELVKVNDIIEKPKTNPPSNLAVIGRYVFTPAIFDSLENLKPGIGGEYQLTDAIKDLLTNEKVYGELVDGNRYDIGKADEYFQLLKKLQTEQND